MKKTILEKALRREYFVRLNKRYHKLAQQHGWPSQLVDNNSLEDLIQIPDKEFDQLIEYVENALRSVEESFVPYPQFRKRLLKIVDKV